MVLGQPEALRTSGADQGRDKKQRYPILTLQHDAVTYKCAGLHSELSGGAQGLWAAGWTHQIGCTHLEPGSSIWQESQNLTEGGTASTETMHLFWLYAETGKFIQGVLTCKLVEEPKGVPLWWARDKATFGCSHPEALTIRTIWESDSVCI